MRERKRKREKKRTKEKKKKRKKEKKRERVGVGERAGGEWKVEGKRGERPTTQVKRTHSVVREHIL